VDHQQNAKITSLVWNPDKSNEIAFCDALGQLSCIEIVCTNIDYTNLIHFNLIIILNIQI
jgi:hypothetical protein